MKKLVIGASVLVGLLLLVYVVRSVGYEGIVQAYRDADKVWFALFLLVSVCVPITLILRWHIILKSQGIRVPLHRLFLYRIVGFASAYVTPSPQFGGDPIRAMMLRREGVVYSKALSTVLIDKSLEMGTNLLFAFIGFVFIVTTYTVTGSTLTVLLVALLASVVFLALFYYRILSGKGYFSTLFYLLRLHKRYRLRRFENHIRDMEVGIAMFFKYHRNSLKLALLFSLLSWVFMFVEYQAALLTFNYDASVTTLFLVITVMGAAYTIPIPAALGVLEGGQASLFRVLQIPAAKGVALGLLIRVRDIGWVLVGIFYLVNYGWLKSVQRLRRW